MKRLLVSLLVLVGLTFAGDLDPNGINQGDLYTLLNNLHYAELYQTLGSADIATVNSSTSLNVATAIEYKNNGKIYNLGSAAFPVTAGMLVGSAEDQHTYSAAVPTVIYGIHVDSSGAYKVNRSNGDWFPSIIDGYTPLAAIEVTLDSDNTAGFTAATTDWDTTTSMNIVIYDLGVMSSGQNKVKMKDL
jgi:hypothetical protein